MLSKSKFFLLRKKMISHKDTKALSVILRMTFGAQNLKSYFVLVSRLISIKCFSIFLSVLCAFVVKKINP